MADKNITIAIKATGADAAAREIEKVVDVIKTPADQDGGSFEDVFGGIPDAFDDIVDKAPDVTDAVDKLDGAIKGVGQHIASSKGFGREFAAASSVVSGSAIAVVASVAAIGAAAVKSYQMLDETVQRYRDLQQEMQAAGEGLGAELEAEIEKLEARLGPLKTVVDGVAGVVGDFFKIIKDPVGEISGINDLTAAWARQKETLELVKKARTELATENQGDLARNYQFELQSLKQQEETLQRIAKLRGDMSNLANEAAQQEVESARLRGGDVPLAQANALATKLQGELEALQNNLAVSQAKAETALSQHSAAINAYEKATADSLNELSPQEFEKIFIAVDNAKIALDTANQAVIDQQQTFSAAKQNILRGAENELAKLEAVPEQVSAEAQKARDAIYNTVKTEFANGPQAAIEQIQVEVGTITTAATGKAAEVQQGLSTERAGTVQAIEKLAPTPQDTQAIVQAVQSVGKAIADQGNAIISALGSVVAGMNQITGTITRQQAQINQLFARVR
jgi:hypothetical protein